MHTRGNPPPSLPLSRTRKFPISFALYIFTLLVLVLTYLFHLLCSLLSPFNGNNHCDLFAYINKSCMRWQKGIRKKEASKFASFYDDVYTTHEEANLRKETQHHERESNKFATDTRTKLLKETFNCHDQRKKNY